MLRSSYFHLKKNIYNINSSSLNLYNHYSDSVSDSDIKENENPFFNIYEKELKERLNKFNKPKVNYDEATDHIEKTLKGRKKLKEELDTLIPYKKEFKKQPNSLLSSKYDINKNLTTKSTTYFDFIRSVPKKDLPVTLDYKYKNANRLNQTLLEFFRGRNYIEGRNFFYKVLRNSNVANLQSYNIVICELIDGGEVFYAADVFNLLEESQYSPDIITYNAMISGCIKYGSIWGVKKYLHKMKIAGIEENKTTKEYLICLYLKNKDLDNVNIIIDELGGEDNLSSYLYGLFARTYCDLKDFNNMKKYAWCKNNIPSHKDCNYIVLSLLDSASYEELSNFINMMHEKSLTISYFAGKRAFDVFTDSRYNINITSQFKTKLDSITEEPSRDEKIQMLRKSVNNDDEREMQKPNSYAKPPVWERKVQFKHPADTAWDTLIQEYLAIASKEKRMTEKLNNLRKPLSDMFRAVSKPSTNDTKEIKTQERWKL